MCTHPNWGIHCMCEKFRWLFRLHDLRFDAIQQNVYYYWPDYGGTMHRCGSHRVLKYSRLVFVFLFSKLGILKATLEDSEKSIACGSEAAPGIFWKHSEWKALLLGDFSSGRKCGLYSRICGWSLRIVSTGQMNRWYQCVIHETNW